MKSWKSNLAIAWIAQFLSIAGFSVAMPFLPFYIRDLGVTDLHQVELWTGVLNSSAALSMALVSPIWGLLADRHGRKLMVLRSTFGGAIILGAMAFAGNVQQLFVMRLIQGMLTGTVPAFMTLVASFAPAAEAGMALGLMQMAAYSGAFVGPLIGGVVADQFGYRWAYLATGLLLFASGLLVRLLLHEEFTPPKPGATGNGIGASAHTIVHSLPVLGAVLTLGGAYLGNTISQSLLPLFVEDLLPRADLVNTSTGTIYGIWAISSAVAAVLMGRLSDRVGHRLVLLGCALGAILGYVGQGLSPNYGVLLAMTFFAGICTGGIIPAANSILARDAPKEQQGAIYGVSNSVNAAGRAIGPMLGASVATAWGLRAPFITAGVVFALVAGWVAAVVGHRPGAALGKPPALSVKRRRARGG